ncbi:MAG: isochorismate synthase [Deltaproteobacteria bacterium]|nr:isochorismate synthase [Deltaproteobacteria bacterium]
MALNDRDGSISDAVESARTRAQETQTTQWLAWRMRLPGCDPLAVWAAAEGDVRFFWEQPAAERALAATGASFEFTAEGPTRIGDAAIRARQVMARVHVAGEAAPLAAGPLLVGGFAFDDAHAAQGEWSRFPGARLVLPRMLVSRIGEDVYCTLVEAIEPGAAPTQGVAALEERSAAVRSFEGMRWVDEGEHESPHLGGALGARAGSWPPGAEYRVLADRPHEVFRTQVAEAVACIRDAEFEKVVLARSLEVQHPGRFDLPGFLHRLRGIYPHCTVLAFGDGEDTLLAATPELLVALEGDTVRACALAGSQRRGRTPEEDEALGCELLEDKKNLAEHAAVERALRAVLEDACAGLEAPNHPELMRIEGIQHLATPMRGQLSEAASPKPDVLDLVDRIHPTPAVAGEPSAASIGWIAEKEGLDRGWYAGPVGWIDRHGGGEFWLALRSGLVRNPERGSSQRATPWARARLYAGVGIVSGSQPDQELRETRIKLRALLAPLTEI